MAEQGHLRMYSSDDRREDLVGDERQCHSLLVKGGAALQPS